MASAGAEHLQLLRRLRRLLLRNDQGQLIFLWGDDPRSLDWLHGELDRSLRARSRRMVRHAAAAPAGLSETLSAVLQPAAGTALFSLWIELGDSARRKPLLARLNEGRAALLAPRRSVLLVGRSDGELASADLAPDLWAVRSASFGVPPWATSAAVEPDPPQPGSSAAAASGAPLPQLALWDQAWAVAQPPKRWLQRWWQRWLRSRGQPVADLNLDLGFAAVDEAVDHGQLVGAERVLAQLAARLGKPAPDASPQALRRAGQLAWWQSQVALQQGRLPVALATAHESLALDERLVALTGESPQALRDWWVSLDRVGDVQQALGNLAGARGRFEQGLEVSQRLVGLTGDSPQALHDLAISFERLGAWCLAQQLPAEARQHFERDLAAAEAALRQSPLSQDIQRLVDYARAKLATLPPAASPNP